MIRTFARLLAIGLMSALFAVPAWSAEDAGAAAGAEHATPITVTRAERKDLEVWESAVGQLEPKIAPMLAAEVAGRLIGVHIDVGDQVKRGQVLAEIDPGDYRLAKAAAQADIEQVQALLRVQKLQVNRLRTLVRKRAINQSTLDDAEAQLGALQAQLAGAHVRLQQAERSLTKTRILAPFDARVDSTQVSRGDYVKVGTPLFRIVTRAHLKARLPYPESLLPVLHPGLLVLLTSPSAPTLTLEAKVSEVRPSITRGSRSLQVIVNLDNPGPWEPGASVTGRIRVARHEGAVMVPENSVVLRPAGAVVYVLDGAVVRQRVVKTGLHQRGEIEILKGLAAGTVIAFDGAGFLTDGAPVEVKAR